MQGCGNSKIFYLSRDKQKAKMYLLIENFACPKEQISLYLTVLKQYETRNISTLVNSIDPDQLASLVNSVDPDQLASEEAS